MQISATLSWFVLPRVSLYDPPDDRWPAGIYCSVSFSKNQTTYPPVDSDPKLSSKWFLVIYPESSLSYSSKSMYLHFRKQNPICSWLTHSHICAFFFHLNNTFCQCFYCPIKPIFRETFVTHSVPAKHCHTPWVCVPNHAYPLHTLNHRRHYDLFLDASFRSPWTFLKTVFC